MALTVGTDTYISQADATTYVGNYYATTSAKYIAWAALTSDNKDAYLRRAAVIIDRQPIVGVKANYSQTMQFPRAIFSTYRAGLDWPTLDLDFSGSWEVQSAVPNVVKYAQVEIALQECVGVSARTTAQREGVKSVTLGRISETYTTGNSTQDISSYEARQLLGPHIHGGYGIA
jgi:hypothetical protein